MLDQRIPQVFTLTQARHETAMLQKQKSPARSVLQGIHVIATGFKPVTG